MNKVFVPNNRKPPRDYDLTDANRFGEIVLVTEDKVNIFNMAELRATVKEKLVEANETDFIVMIGSPVINALCASYMLLKFNRVNFLIFDAKSRAYEVRSVTKGEVT